MCGGLVTNEFSIEVFIRFSKNSADQNPEQIKTQSKPGEQS